MAARLLRRVAVSPGTTSTTIISVPAARALVGTMLIANTTSGPVTITNVSIAGAGILANFNLNPGETYTERIIIAASESLTAIASAAASCVITVFGEEVDN